MTKQASQSHQLNLCTNMVQDSAFALEFDQLLTAIVQLDDQLHITYMNAAAETLLDGSRKRLLGVPFFSLFSHSSLQPDLLRHALNDQQSVSDSDVTFTFHDGQQVTVEFIAQPLSSQAFNTQPPSVLLELRQVDQIRRINQENTQQQQLQAAHSMIRGLAHEIKNPLGGLRGAAQLLALELPDASMREYTDLIISQADRLRNLVDRMLGSHELPKRAPVNVHEILERVIQVAKLGASPDVNWHRDYDPSLPEITIAAEGIEQALLNLVMNGCEATSGQGDAELTLRTRVSHQQTLYGRRYRYCAVIEVQDNGPGIAPAIKDTLFYPMVSGRAGGTGLGLTIAQNVVHQHAGKIEVSSQPGCTRFTVYLPYTETREDKPLAGSDHDE